MGFDLKPRNKKAGPFHMGAFSWSWMIDAGVGLPLRCGPGITPGHYVFNARKDGLCAYCNDGARVTSEEAKNMAHIAEMVASYQETLNDIWLKIPQEERKRMSEDYSKHYNIPVRKDFVELAREFSKWAVKSGGFRIF